MSKIDVERVQEIFDNEQNITKTAKKYAEEEGIEYNDGLRRKFSNIINKNKVDSDLDVKTKTETNQYSNDKERNESFSMPSAWAEDLNRFLSIDEYCDRFGLPKEQVRSSKLVSHVANHMIYNIAFKETILSAEENLSKEYIQGLFDDIYVNSQEIIVSYTTNNDNNWFDRLVYTDVHVAMNVNSDGDPMYDGKWDEEELFIRLDKMVSHTLDYKKSNTLYIDELGDFLDGFSGQTTRGGHKLPQNMNNKECFEIGLKFKICLIERLVGHFDTIHCNNICNDNHAGDWGYVVNHAFKMYIEQKYPNKVKVINHKRFLNHYTVGKHTFVITHGKEKEALKFGYKSILDDKGYVKIDQYCKEHSLYNGNNIEFSMGDQHQYKTDYTTSNDFIYCAYPALSPPSNWVKSNFSKSKSGFVLFNIDKGSQIKISIPFIFKKQKNMN